MRIPRFICPEARGAREGDVVALDARESAHLVTVLRREAGAAILLLPGDGFEWTAKVVEADPRRATARLEERSRETTDSGPDGEPDSRAAACRIVLGLALARGGAFEAALESAAELGVDEVIPLVCARCVVRLGGGAEIARKVERWRRILESAAKQSGRLRFTALHAPMEFAEWTRWEREGAPPDFGISGEPARVAGGEAPRPGLWIAQPGARVSLFDEALRWHEANRFRPGRAPLRPPAAAAAAGGPPRAVVAIGPEGGFSPGELERAREEGFEAVRLPGATLRVATAAVAAVAAIQLALENSSE